MECVILGPHIAKSLELCLLLGHLLEQLVFGVGAQLLGYLADQSRLGCWLVFEVAAAKAAFVLVVELFLCHFVISLQFVE